MITENIVVVKTGDEQQLQDDFCRYQGTHRLSKFNKVYGDTNIVVYVFDANGDSPWELESDTVVPLALETNYLDGERPWTRVNGKDYDWPLSRWLKRKIPVDQYEQVKQKLQYSC